LVVFKSLENIFLRMENFSLNDIKNKYFCRGELAEWSIAAVLKTVELKGSWGSNP
jgi:hypothetical protein